MNDAVALLRELIRIPSVNPSSSPSAENTGEAAIAGFLHDYLRARGIDCALREALPGRPNLVAVIEGQRKPAIVLEAHTDTIDAGGMEISPFDPGDDPEVVRGRGACDDKASLAAMVTAFVRVCESGKPSQSVILAATVDEEYRFRGVRALLDAGLPLPAAGAIVGEPTRLKVIRAHKGVVRLRITALGRAVHSSEPEKGDNAIYHIARIVQALELYAQDLGRRAAHPLVGPPTCAATIVHGGTAINVVPDQCALDVDRRILPGEVAEQVAEEMRHVIATAVAGRFLYRVEELLLDQPMETLAEAPLVRRCLNAVASVCGRAEVAGVAFGSDANKFTEAGIPAVVLGPGDIAQAHTASEFVLTAEVEQAAEVYYRAVTAGED